MCAIFDRLPDFDVVGEATDGAHAIRQALDQGADLAVLDVSMPRMTGLQAAGELTRRSPRTRVLMLSMHDNEQYFEALKAGASGYVLKSAVDRDLVDACRAAMRGEPCIYPAAGAALVQDHLRRAARGEQIPRDPLTRREQEIAKLIAEAYTYDDIAQALVVSRKTVERHRANILESSACTTASN